MAVAYYDDEIYLLFVICLSCLWIMHNVSSHVNDANVFSGSYEYQNQFVRYNITNNKFVDEGQYYLSDTEYGFGTFYSQLNDMLFTITNGGDNIRVYFLQNMTREYLEEPIPYTVSASGCITSAEAPIARLYVTGGTDTAGEAMRNLQIFDFNSTVWIQGTDMGYSRASHGCIVVNDGLWVMGWAPEIESIDTIGIDNISIWEIKGSLSTSYIVSFAVVAVHDMIFVIGGYDKDCKSDGSACVIGTMYIIETKSGNVESESMEVSLYGTAAIVIDSIIYRFGGADSLSITTDNWQGSSWRECTI